MSGVVTAFEFISQNAPSWIKALEDLEKTIKERQAQVARVPASQDEPPKKVKKSGSNESIRPCSNGEGEDGREDDVPSPSSPQYLRGPFVRQPFTSIPIGRKRKTAAGADSSSMISTANSLLVNNNGNTAVSLPMKYRSRSMIIVYYDSEIQKSFEQIVRHIGSARNNIRRARTTERMERLAVAVDMASDEGDATGGNSPLIMFRSTRSTTRSTTPSRPTNDTMKSPLRIPRTPAVGPNSPESRIDAFSEADVALENAQSLCEKGAHTFLREGDCEAEIAGARESFENAKRLADRELLRIKSEEEQRKKQKVENPPKSPDGQEMDGTREVGPQNLEVDEEGEDLEDVEALLKMPRFRLMART